MGLSTSEKEGCRQILHNLGTSDLLSLYETVMKAKTTVRDRAELIDRIIEESKTTSELLNRKKVYRDIILQYLNNERIFMYAKSTKHEAIRKSIEHWTKTDIPITVESEAAKNSVSCSLQLQSTVSDTNLGQLAIQINGLSIDSNEADKAESFTMRYAQVHQNDLVGKLPPKSVHKAASSPRKTPCKGKTVPHHGEFAPSKSNFTNQSCMTGAKPKGKAASTISLSTTLSFTVTTVTPVSKEKMGHRTKKQ